MHDVLSSCKYYIHSHTMGENGEVSLNHTPLADFHSRSSKVFVGSRHHKTQRNFKGKKSIYFKGLILILLPFSAHKHMYICINSGHNIADTFKCMSI